MNFKGAIFITPYLLSALISIIVAVYAWKRRSTPGATLLAILSILEAEWTLGYIGQLIAPDLASKLFWNNAQFFGAIFVPLAYSGFTFDFSGQDIKKSHQTWKLVSIVPILILVLVWTDGWHGLFRQDPHIIYSTPFTTLEFKNGTAFGIYPVYAYTLLIFSTYFLVARLVATPKIYRLQSVTVLAGILIPWVTTFVTMAGFSPWKLHDVTPVTFGVSNLIIGWALFRYRLFDILPVARDTLIEKMRDGVIVLDQSLRLVDFNPEAGLIFNLQNQDLGKPALSQIPNILEWMEQKGQPVEITRTVNGKEYVYEVLLIDVDRAAQSGNGLLITLRDITDRKLVEEKLRNLAITDSLTELFNRRHFFELAQSDLARAKRYNHSVALIIIDVDHFKRINDHFGHQTGDQVLQALASSWKQDLRANDKIARYGGEEFIILLPESELPEAVQTAERLRAIAQDTEIATPQGVARVSVSIGVAASPAAGLELDQLIQKADQALYHAKSEGRNRVNS